MKLKGGALRMRKRTIQFSAVLVAAGGITATFVTEPAVDWIQVVSRNRPATVLIRVESPNGDISFGSGVVVSDTGQVLTAAHLLPSGAIREAGNVLITCLVGWDHPSLDFSVASALDVQHVSETRDLAVLRFRSLPAHARAAFVSTNVSDGQPVLVMGYPSGGALRSTSGIASGLAEGGKYATDAAVGRGNSGGPVFNRNGGLVGIILEGTRRDMQGQIALGFFVTTDAILEYFVTENITVNVARSDPGVKVTPSLEVRIAHGVSEMKDDHPVVLVPHARDYIRRFAAQEGYEIIEATFESNSANHVSRGPTVRVEPDRGAVIVEFTLESGPVFDQWRGWLSGNVVTRQRARSGARQ
jgi:S1-C subfamily serine protease